MKKAIAIVSEGILNSGIRGWMERACNRPGVEVEFINANKLGKEYVALFRSHKNVITWNCRMTHGWLRRWGNNVLHLDNSLLCQSAGIFLDSGGFYSQSNLCREQTWKQDHLVDLDAFTKHWFEWSMVGGMPGGPILVCLQNPKDTNIVQEFPLGEKRADKLMAAMELLYHYMPYGQKAVIRPHPRFAETWQDVAGKTPWRDDWRLSTEGNLKDILPNFSAMVTVNSTCASEAISLGMRVATLGTGCWSGSGTTLECAERPWNLAKLMDFEPDLHACERYCRAVIGRHFVPYCIEGDTPNIEMERWLARCF